MSDSDYAAGYEAAIADLRFLAEARADYGSSTKVETLDDYFQLSETDRRIHDEVRTGELLALILSGRNDACGWLPSWHWDSWRERHSHARLGQMPDAPDMVMDL